MIGYEEAVSNYKRLYREVKTTMEIFKLQSLAELKGRSGEKSDELLKKVEVVIEQLWDLRGTLGKKWALDQKPDMGKIEEIADAVYTLMIFRDALRAAA